MDRSNTLIIFQCLTNSLLFQTSEPSEGPISIESIAKELEAGKYKNVVIMCGAGISTHAGVPDFRRYK